MAITQGDISQQLVDTSVRSDELLANHGIPVFEVPFVSVGGGIGSFSMVDTLRIAVVSTRSASSLIWNAHQHNDYQRVLNAYEQHD